MATPIRLYTLDTIVSDDKGLCTSIDIDDMFDSKVKSTIYRIQMNGEQSVKTYYNEDLTFQEYFVRFARIFLNKFAKRNGKKTHIIVWNEHYIGYMVYPIPLPRKYVLSKRCTLCLDQRPHNHTNGNALPFATLPCGHQAHVVCMKLYARQLEQFPGAPAFYGLCSHCEIQHHKTCLRLWILRYDFNTYRNGDNKEHLMLWMGAWTRRVERVREDEESIMSKQLEGMFVLEKIPDAPSTPPTQKRTKSKTSKKKSRSPPKKKNNNRKPLCLKLNIEINKYAEEDLPPIQLVDILETEKVVADAQKEAGVSEML